MRMVCCTGTRQMGHVDNDREHVTQAHTWRQGSKATATGFVRHTTHLAEPPEVSVWAAAAADGVGDVNPEAPWRFAAASCAAFSMSRLAAKTTLFNLEATKLSESGFREASPNSKGTRVRAASSRHSPKLHSRRSRLRTRKPPDSGAASSYTTWSTAQQDTSDMGTAVCASSNPNAFVTRIRTKAWEPPPRAVNVSEKGTSHEEATTPPAMPKTKRNRSVEGRSSMRSWTKPDSVLVCLRKVRTRKTLVAASSGVVTSHRWSSAVESSLGPSSQTSKAPRLAELERVVAFDNSKLMSCADRDFKKQSVS